jgi:archaellum biogenesis protein FlaJ (TadC family)
MMKQTTHEHEKPSGHARTGKIRIQLIIVALSLVLAILVFLFTKNIMNATIAFIAINILAPLCLFARSKMQKSAELRKMEEIFPDFIELMSSNLRAGMTIDKALLLSSRKEFSPLDKEITILGKDIVTGKDISLALIRMAERIQSEKIRKTIDIIISGIKSGGNISVLLEETAVNMRERAFVEKKAASNVLMYIIFIFFAVAVGAPVLFGLSSALVQIMTNILSTIPPSTQSLPINAPITLTKISISVSFITWLSVIFLLVTSFLASALIGLVSKGDEKSGLKYALPLAFISTAIFFTIKILMGTYFSGLFT